MQCHGRRQGGDCHNRSINIRADWRPRWRRRWRCCEEVGLQGQPFNSKWCTHTPFTMRCNIAVCLCSVNIVNFNVGNISSWPSVLSCSCRKFTVSSGLMAMTKGCVCPFWEFMEPKARRQKRRYTHSRRETERRTKYNLSNGWIHKVKGWGAGETAANYLTEKEYLCSSAEERYLPIQYLVRYCTMHS